MYRGVKLECGYRLDLLIENEVIVEIKSVEKLLPIHKAQLMSYLKLSDCKVGLLINFNVEILKDGIQRVVNNFPILSVLRALCGEKLPMINKLIELCLKNRFLVICFYLLVIFGGIFGLKNINMDVIPDIGKTSASSLPIGQDAVPRT